LKGEPSPLVVHIIYALGTGGLENGLVNIINRTPADRYRHAIVCLTTSHDFAGRLTNKSVQIIELHMKPGTDIGMYRRLWKTLRRLKPDIVHTRNLAALETQILGIFMPGVKRVHGEHGRDISDLDGSNWKYRLLRKFMRPLVHRYIAVSQDLANWLEESIGVSPERIHQVYNGVDQSRFRPGGRENSIVFPPEFLPPGKFVVLGGVGRLAEVKDQGIIFEALADLLARNPALRESLRVILVGDGPLMATLKSQVSALNLDGMVWMPGDRDDIPNLLQAMDIFLLPSLAEGVSNTLLEAMASGLPAIATAIGGTPEIVDNGVTGLLVPVGDASALSSAMMALVESPTDRERLGVAARNKVLEKFDWDVTVVTYLGIYDELLGRRPRPSSQTKNAAVVELGAE
jgi:sugar transferase (PEP-CTERM/EpsH1 system associated)